MTILAAGRNIEFKTGVLNATTPDIELALGSAGNMVFDNVWLIMTISALSAGRTMDITAKDIGMAAYRTAVIVTQIDLKANDADTIAQDLSGKGPIRMIKLDTNLVSAETVTYSLCSW